MRKMRTERLIICTGSHDSGVHIWASLTPRCTWLAIVLLAPWNRCTTTRGPFPYRAYVLLEVMLHAFAWKPSSNVCWNACGMWNSCPARCSACGFRLRFGVLIMDYRSPERGGVIKKGFREQEGVQLTLEEGNHLDSSQVWKASQVSGVPRTCQVTWGLWISEAKHSY